MRLIDYLGVYWCLLRSTLLDRFYTVQFRLPRCYVQAKCQSWSDGPSPGWRCGTIFPILVPQCARKNSSLRKMLLKRNELMTHNSPAYLEVSTAVTPSQSPLICGSPRSSIIPMDIVDKMVSLIHPVFFLLVDESSVVGGPSRAAPLGRGFGAMVCCDPTRAVEEDVGALEDDAGALDGAGPYDVG